MREAEFQRNLIRELKDIFPGIEIMKQDASYRQGQPDLVLFYRNKYAMLECKRSEYAHHQPNQDYYVSKFDDWAFARFIYPENKEKVITDLKGWFKNE